MALPLQGQNGEKQGMSSCWGNTEMAVFICINRNWCSMVRTKCSRFISQASLSWAVTFLTYCSVLFLSVLNLSSFGDLWVSIRKVGARRKKFFIIILPSINSVPFFVICYLGLSLSCQFLWQLLLVEMIPKTSYQ